MLTIQPHRTTSLQYLRTTDSGGSKAETCARKTSSVPSTPTSGAAPGLPGGTPLPLPRLTGKPQENRQIAIDYKAALPNDFRWSQEGMALPTIQDQDPAIKKQELVVQGFNMELCAFKSAFSALLATPAGLEHFNSIVSLADDGQAEVTLHDHQKHEGPTTYAVDGNLMLVDQKNHNLFDVHTKEENALFQAIQLDASLKGTTLTNRETIAGVLDRLGCKHEESIHFGFDEVMAGIAEMEKGGAFGFICFERGDAASAKPDWISNHWYRIAGADQESDTLGIIDPYAPERTKWLPEDQFNGHQYDIIFADVPAKPAQGGLSAFTSQMHQTGDTWAADDQPPPLPTTMPPGWAIATTARFVSQTPPPKPPRTFAHTFSVEEGRSVPASHTVMSAPPAPAEKIRPAPTPPSAPQKPPFFERLTLGAAKFFSSIGSFFWNLWASV